MDASGFAYGHLSSEEKIRSSIAALARVCFDETGTPPQSANVRRRASRS
jgi:hypothetical protein